MSVVFSGHTQEYHASRNEKWVGEVILTADALRSATISSAQGATIGTSTTPTSNTALATTPTVSGSSVFVTVLASEWPATVTTVYVGLTVTLSDGRIIPCRVDLKMDW